MSETTTEMPDLPPEVARLIRPYLPPDDEVLQAIGIAIASKRDEAKAARTKLERLWKAAEDAYASMDDANRHEYDPAWEKPSSMDGPLVNSRMPTSDGHRSTAFVPLTARYVDAGVAKLTEILLPADQRAFSLKGTPVPRLIAAKEDDSEVVHSELGVTLTRPLEAGETPPPPAGPPPAPQDMIPPPGSSQAPPVVQGVQTPGQPAAPPAEPRVPIKTKDFAAENIEKADEQAKLAEDRIYDWMTETGYRSEIRKVIFDAAKLGVGVLKGPVSKEIKAVAVIKDENGEPDVKREKKIVPGCEWVDTWNFFPDAACGENIQHGDYCFERNYMSTRRVRGLKALPGYIGSKIDQVLEEGPDKINTRSHDGKDATERKNQYEVWYFYGQLSKDELAAIDQAAGKETVDDDGEDGDGYVVVTLINDSVVRATLSPRISGEFPFHAMPWRRRAGSWAGVGVPEQMRTAQRVTNAALRAMLNNAGLSAGVQIIMDQAAIRGSDGNENLTPNKIWLKTNDGPPDVRQSFMVVEIPNQTEPMTRIIEMGERFAEESTSIPLITQGQSGATTPDTFGAAQLQNNNANQLLRSIGYAFDDYITEPVVRQYYELLLIDPKVPPNEKGDYQIDAHGSIALVERAIQDQFIIQLGQLVVNPAYKMDPAKWADELLLSKHMAPDRFKYTAEEQQKMEAAPQPEAPQIAVARINSDTQLKIAVMAQTADQRTAEAEGQIAAAAHSLEVGNAQVEHQLAAHGLDIEARKAADAAKAKLAEVAIKIQAERDLHAADQAMDRGMHDDAQAVDLHKHASDQAAESDRHGKDQEFERERHDKDQAFERDQHDQDHAVDLHKHHNPPPVQLPGRAGNGRAFEQGRPN